MEEKEWYQVREGQTLRQIAQAFGVSAYVLARENGLQEEPSEGRLLHIPTARGNAYTAQEGDSKRLLCGSEGKFAQKNGEHLYLGMRVIL